MIIEFIEINGDKIARIKNTEIIVFNFQDAVDLMANCWYQGVDKIIIEAKHLTNDFFDLKTGLAGDILQKFSNYRCRLAIIGDYSVFKSKSLLNFIIESNRGNQIFFVENEEKAVSYLCKN